MCDLYQCYAIIQNAMYLSTLHYMYFEFLNSSLPGINQLILEGKSLRTQTTLD